MTSNQPIRPMQETPKDPNSHSVSSARAGGYADSLLVSAIIWFDDPAAVVCDAKCSKAWGINNRPRIELSDDPDDFAFLADSELGVAPDDPGTFEGGCGKPTRAGQRHNKWCVRECERSTIIDGRGVPLRLGEFSKRLYNKAERSA